MSEPQKVGRRTFLNYAIVAIATGVIVGATTYFAVPKGAVTVTAPGTTVTTTVTGTTTPTATFTPRSINWIFPGTSDTERAWAEWVKSEVNRIKPGNITSFNVQYIGWPDLYDKLNAMFMAGNPPQMVWECDAVRWARLGKVQILDDLVADWPDWKVFRQPAVKSAGMYWNGHQLAVPTIQHAECFNYRNDIVLEYWGKPGTEIKTWDDWLDAAEAIHLKKPGLYAFALDFDQYAAREVFPWIAAANGMNWKGDNFFNKDNHDKIVHTLEFLKEVYKKYSMPGAESMAYKDTQVALGAGQCAFSVHGGTWNYGNIEPAYPEACVEGKLTADFWPHGPDTDKSYHWTSGCGDFIVSGQTAEQIKQCFEVIKVIHSPLGCAKFAGAMHVPARTDVSIDMVIENDWYNPKEKYRWWLEKTYQIMNATDRLQPWYSLPAPDETGRAWYEIIWDYWKDKINVEECYNRLLSKTKEIWGNERPAGGE